MALGSELTAERKFMVYHGKLGWFRPYNSAHTRQTDLGLSYGESNRWGEASLRTGRLATAVAVGVLGLLLAMAPTEVDAQAYYAVTVKVSGFPATLRTNVFLDGAFNGTMVGGETRVYNFSAIPPLTHTLTVDFYVPGSQGQNGTRYVSRTNSWTFNGPANHVFEYSAQYFLTVQSEYATVTGQGWYDDGDRTVASVSVGEIPSGPGIRQLFTGWGGDASGSELRSNEILMDAPKKAVANWKTQYLLTIVTNPVGLVQPEGAGWKDSGSTATFRVAEIVTSGTGARLVFTSWSGDYAGPSAGGSILMDGPKTIAANYRAQYLITIRYAPQSLASRLNLTGEGWHDALATVAVGTVPSQLEVSSVERLVLDGWVDNGNRLGPSNTISVYMDGPHTIDLVYHRQFLLQIQSKYGQTFGEGWYDEGATARFGIQNVPSEWMVQYIFKEWNIQPQAAIQSVGNMEWQLKVDRPYLLQAVWEQSYTPLITILGGLGAVGALIVVGAAVVLRHSKGLGFLRTPGGRRRRAELPVPIPPSTGLKSCVGCGARIPAAAAFCHFCGNSQEIRAAPAESRAPVVASAIDDRVFNYIVAHEGVISLSKAAQELGIHLDELKAATERLKRAGRLS